MNKIAVYTKTFPLVVKMLCITHQFQQTSEISLQDNTFYFHRDWKSYDKVVSNYFTEKRIINRLADDYFIFTYRRTFFYTMERGCRPRQGTYTVSIGHIYADVKQEYNPSES